jgi:Tol biopolymer transport system component
MPPHDQLQPELSSGTRLGPYVVESFLGAGGMGQVYRAMDDRLQRPVAIKLLPSQFSGDADRLRRFEQEARLAGSLSHPNVLGIFDVGTHEGSPFIVTEFLEGQTLRQRLRGHYLSAPRALEISRQITDGLGAAHARGIIHRDLKPSNVFLCASGPVKILDFGVAKLLHRDPKTGEPTTGWTTEAVPGTIGYLAPEQAHGRRIDHRADIFAFGCVLFEMLSGRKAFPGATPAEILVATLSSDPPDLSDVTSDVPPALARVVRCCLSKEPDDRYSTVHDLRLALDSAGEQLARGRWLPRVRLGRATRRWMGVGLAGALLAAAGGWGWSLLSRGRLPTFTPRQVTSGAGLEQHPALSPDGSFVAYAAVERGNSDIWITDLQGDASLRLAPDDAWDESPAWLPDGGSLVFVSDRGGPPGVWKVSRLGGEARLLVPDAHDPAVSPDGRLLAFTRPNAAGFRRLAVAPLDRPGEARVLSRGGLRHDQDPVWSPDGRRILYADFNHLWVVGLDGDPPRRLTAEGQVEMDPAWSPDGEYVYFSAFRDGLTGIWRRRVAGGDAEPVERGPGEARWSSVSVDGRRLAFTSRTLQETLVAVDTSTGRRARFEEAWRTQTPTVAPDGSRVLFVSTRQNAVDLWRLPLGADPLRGPPERVTDTSGRLAWPRYSPDGRWIAYQGNFDGQRDVWTVPGEGGPAHRFTEDPGEDTAPAWSPDGSRIAFVSDRGGEEALWVAPVREGRRTAPPRRVCRGSESVVWSRDGTRLAFLDAAEGEADVWVVPVEGEAAPRRLTHGAAAVEVRWSGSGERLSVLGFWEGHVPVLRNLDPATGVLAPVQHGEAAGPYSQIQTFDVTPDGRWLILLEETPRGDVWVLEAQGGTF